MKTKYSGQLDQVMYQIARAKGTGKVTRPNVGSKPNLTLRQLQRDTDDLYQEFTDAVNAGDNDEILSIGPKLGRYLIWLEKAESKLYKSVLKVLAPVYPDARSDLINNIGQYCSFCEMPLAANLAIEHMLPKRDFPDLLVSWTNFLLACPVCNSHKLQHPNLQESINAALKTTAPENLTPQIIQDAGYSLYLWPSDTGYRSFTMNFQYEIRSVVYTSEGNLVIEDYLSAMNVISRAKNNEIFLAGEDGHDVLARFYELKQNAVYASTATDINDLQALGLPITINTANQNWTRLPDDVVRGLAKARIDLTSAYSQFTLTQGTPYPEDTPCPDNTLQNLMWTITETQSLQFDTSGRYLRIQSMENGEFLDTEIPANTVNAALRHRVIPPEVWSVLGLSWYEWSVDIQQWRSPFDVTLTRQILLAGTADDRLLTFIIATTAVEIQIKSVSASSSFWVTETASSRVINSVALNARVASDPKNSDRRVINRTRAWFVAMQSVRNLKEATRLQKTGNPIYANLVDQTLDAVRETAIATGFWTVWYSVVFTYLNHLSSIYTPLMNMLLDTANFPGTRR
jgi:hypothetical protein